jgi:transposase
LGNSENSGRDAYDGERRATFETVSQLVSWAGVCPGNNESAGKRKTSRLTKGNVHLKTALVEAPLNPIFRSS